MQTLIFSIHDDKTNTFMKPINVSSEVDIQRITYMATKNPESNIHHFPEDFSVYKLGTFDDTTGKIEISEKPEFKFNVKMIYDMAKKEGKS